MKKVINYSNILVVLIILSCQGYNNRVEEKNTYKKSNSSHLGTWELVYFQSIRGTDTTELVSNGKPLAIGFMTPTHFSYQWRNSSNSGAGTYTYDGDIIHQEFKYVRDSSFAGTVLSFNMDVRNDSIFFSGPIKAVSSSGKDILSQIPQMVEIRRRAE